MGCRITAKNERERLWREFSGLTTLLLKNADVLVTMGDDGREIHDGGLFARDGWIEQVGATADLPDRADQVIDCSGMVVIPGLVNTHHHFFQTLTRAQAQNAELFDWLVELYPIWARITPEQVKVSTVTALAELALSGCTTAFDHHYLWPGGTSVDDQVEAAQQVGLRFHAARGSMSVGESLGGLPPDSVVENEADILEDCARVIAAHHDPAPGAMTRVVLAPCSPFSVSPSLMSESAALARATGVRLHTHLAETKDEEAFCLERFGMRPVDFAESLDWMGTDTWFAHAVHVSPEDIDKMAAAGTGVAHCPTSNMRLSSGIAPLRGFMDKKVPVGLGVDGSASNDGSHLLGEARQALLVARTARALEDPASPMVTARQVLRVATAGGARILGRTDIGVLEAGMAADVACYRTSTPAMAGVEDLVAGLILSGPLSADKVLVHGKLVVDGGTTVGLDLDRHLALHRESAQRLMTGDRR